MTLRRKFIPQNRSKFVARTAGQRWFLQFLTTTDCLKWSKCVLCCSTPLAGSFGTKFMFLVHCIPILRIFKGGRPQIWRLPPKFTKFVGFWPILVVKKVVRRLMLCYSSSVYGDTTVEPHLRSTYGNFRLVMSFNC